MRDWMQVLIIAAIFAALLFGVGSCEVWVCKQKHVGASTIGCLLSK
jgi:membrane associated rhomboid family serine protease